MRTKHARRGRRAAPIYFVMFSCLAVVFLLLNASAEAGDEVRESAVCLDCHEDYADNLVSTPHQINSGGDDDPAAHVACSDCHAGDARHYEDDPEEYPRVDPSMLSALNQGELCAGCHMNSHQQNMAEGNVHSSNDLNCSSCHRVHGNKSSGLLQAGQTDLCLSCHTSVAGQFARPYRHPVNDHVVSCSECHTTLDVTSRELSLNGTNAACVECHGEFQGPFPFEHQATVDYSTEEGGCLTCHEAHGSYLPRMVKQPYEPPHYQLCTQCHSVPGHLNNSRHGTEWAGVACNECHTDIHGSYVSRSFLSEALEVQGCFNAGCHQF